MKRMFLLAAASIVVANSVFAQMTQDPFKKPSPPAMINQTITDGGIDVMITYSQPGVKGRTIGKQIAPYDTVWRTGANEATTFQVSKDVTIEGKALPAGKYCLFTIPTAGDWTIILNSELTLPNGKPTWGAYTYHADKDVLRVTVPSKKAKDWSERMTFVVESDGDVILLWGDKKVSFKVAKG